MGTKLHQFHMDFTACRYVFKSGKIAVFEGGVYRTASEVEIKELQDEITAGIGSIWVTKGNEVVDSDDIDPIAVFKRKIIEEYEANKARSLDNGESFSDTSSVKPVSSVAMGAVAAGSNTGGAARVTSAVPAGSVKIGAMSK